MIAPSSTATEKCERILNQSKSYNIENSILSCENLIIDRLLASRNNMRLVYAELTNLLNEQQIELLFSLILSCAVDWNPQKAVSYRAEKKELVETNKEIALAAQRLADLLQRRDELHNYTGFSSDTHYCIINVIEAASANNYLYRRYIKQPLSNLRGRFDLKYWPSIEEVIAELASDANNAEIFATDSLTEASTISRRASKVDFLRALFSAISENSERDFGLIPKSFQLSDHSYAEIMNCALQLEPKQLVDASYVKRERQKQRAQLK